MCLTVGHSSSVPPVLTKSCLGMTAMLTLRRADPCNGGAEAEHCAGCLPVPFPLHRPPGTGKDTKENGHCQPRTGPGTTGKAGEIVRWGKIKAKRFVPVLTASSHAGGPA